MKLLRLLLLCLIPFTGISQSPCNFDSANAYQQCITGQNGIPGGQAIIIFEWFNAPGSCEVTSVSYTNEDGVGPFMYPVQQPPNVPSGNFGVCAGPGNGQPANPNWSVEHYLILNYANGAQSDTIAYTPYPCIPGCMDSLSEAYNPWATEDDGSCVYAGGGTNGCDPGDFEVTIEVTLDSYPNETSWLFVDQSNGNSLFNITQGTYTFNDIGQTYSYTTCIDPIGAV